MKNLFRADHVRHLVTEFFRVNVGQRFTLLQPTKEADSLSPISLCVSVPNEAYEVACIRPSKLV